METKILEMLNLQDNLNTQTSWENWKSWITNKGKIINWKRCIYMELAEAIDSVPWKHWKNIEWKTDLDNFKIEIVDIWHFLLSEILRLTSIEKAQKILEKNLKNISKTKLPILWEEKTNLELDNFIKPYEKLFKLVLKKDTNEKFLKKLAKQFFICLDSTWMDFEELYALYIWKNVLNKFRQNNWYKEWKYIKIWDNKEDNVVMQEVLKNNSNLCFDEVYNELEKIYKNK